MADIGGTPFSQHFEGGSARLVDYRTADMGPGEWTRVAAFDSIAEWYQARAKLNGFQIECLMDMVSQPGMTVMLVREAAVPKARQLLDLPQLVAPLPVLPIESVPSSFATPQSSGAVVQVDPDTFTKLCRHPDVKLIAVAPIGERFRHIMHLEGLVFSTDSDQSITFAPSQQVIHALAIAYPTAISAPPVAYRPPALQPASSGAGNKTAMVILWLALIGIIASIVIVWACVMW
jgi:hypothetical protein